MLYADNDSSGRFGQTASDGETYTNKQYPGTTFAFSTTFRASSPPSRESSRRRTSAFIEVGLCGEDDIIDQKFGRTESRQGLQVRFESPVKVHEPKADNCTDAEEEVKPLQFGSKFAQPRTTSPLSSVMARLFLLAFVLALFVPILDHSQYLRGGVGPVGANAGPVKRDASVGRRTVPDELVRRANSPTDVCTRWSHQTALVNGTLYIYGGRSTAQPGQTSNQWNNNFLTVNLTQPWQISSPNLQGLPQPSNPPAVANGYLWHSYDALYLYGGEFSDTPATSPVPFSTWSYDIGSSSWHEHKSPVSSTGIHAADNNQPVQRAAEGAGISVPSLGRGYYFGGHLDGYTTAGWSQSIDRVYLQSLLEYTFPGQVNAAVNNNQPAGPDGAYRNITEGGLQGSAGFTERADGILVYVPGYSAEGIILGLAGGTNTTFTQMNVIDVYDIANSTWYKQATNGKTPDIRVNPCAVALSAADGSSVQVYMYGGQNLIPYGQQIQYSDMWILTIPSFTWIQVDTGSQATPPARAGHSCDVWNSQIVVTGGYVGANLSCDSPGIYVFNASSLTWQNSYVALAGGNDLNQQESQKHNPAALGGSYGYQVPAPVQSVIGGNAQGSATITAPAMSATQGPFATGKPITYTVTQSNGAVVTETGSPRVDTGNGSGGSSGPNIAAIVAGVIAGLLAVLAAYLAFCIWVYRRQLALYKHHVAMSQRHHLGMSAQFMGIAKTSSDFQSSDSATGSGSGSGAASNRPGLNGGYSQIQPTASLPGGSGTANSSTDDLIAGQAPTFVGVMLNPRRSLRVINRD